MKITIRASMACVFMLATCSQAALASHDNGQGKSQDGKGHVESVAVAPEPSTFWLFTAGAAVVGLATRRRRSGRPDPRRAALPPVPGAEDRPRREDAGKLLALD